MSGNFKKDLEFGRRFEEIAVDYIVEDNSKIKNVEYAPNERFPYWDLRLTYKDEKRETFEVKVDKVCCQTGNFFIEYANNRKQPSGLLTTQADNYVLIAYNEKKGGIIESVYIVPTEVLMDMYNRRNPHYIIKTYPTEGFLVPRKELDEMLIK